LDHCNFSVKSGPKRFHKIGPLFLAVHNVSNTSSQSIAFNNDTYASVDTTMHHAKDDKRETDKSFCDVSYASVNPRTPKSRRTSGNETYMSVHAAGSGQQPPEVLLKRSPVVRDVTTAQIAPTIKVSSSEASKVLPPLPSARSDKTDASKGDATSGYKSLASIPGAGRKVAQEHKSTSTGTATTKSQSTSTSGYKTLSSIPGAGRNLPADKVSIFKPFRTILYIRL
jgi:hypothetical protein